MVLLVLSSFIVHRVVPMVFVTFLSTLHMRFHGYIASQWQNQDCAGWASFQVSPPPDCGSQLTVQGKLQYNLLKSDNSDTKTTNLNIDSTSLRWNKEGRKHVSQDNC